MNLRDKLLKAKEAIDATRIAKGTKQDLVKALQVPHALLDVPVTKERRDADKLRQVYIDVEAVNVDAEPDDRGRTTGWYPRAELTLTDGKAEGETFAVAHIDKDAARRLALQLLVAADLLERGW